MGLGYDEAIAMLTGPGGPFEIEEAEIRGQRLKVFKSTPPSLRAVFDLARTRGDQPFLVYEDEQWSFGEVMRHADALGAALVERYGVEPGDRVSIAMRNYPEWIVAFAAITSVGGVAVLQNAWWTADEIDYGLRDSGSKVLIADLERLERAQATIADAGVATVVVRSEDRSLPAGVDRYEDVVALGTPMPAVDIDPHADATILYTSGTTGRPKGAVSTHHAVLSAMGAFGCRGMALALTSGQGDDAEAAPAPPPALCFILVVPLFHVTGCVAVMLSCFGGGHKLVMMYKWEPGRALQLIEREKVSNFVGVPTMSWDLLESPDFEKYDTTSLAFVGGGGAPAPPELVKRVDGSFRNAAPGIGYGMTETNAYGPQNAGDDYLRKPTSCGRTVPVVEMKVAHEDGVALPSGEVGEIWFRGPNLIRGYWNRPEATAETIVDGWLRSGDIGRIDEEGFVYVQDRAKDMVLRGGENIYCAEVEAAIYEHPAVYEAAVFGMPHERLGEEVAAAIVVKDGHQLETAELQAHVRERLAGFKVPSIVQLGSTSLPRNASGKILKREIRDALVDAG
ncbi:MAG: class I adenylate-forming enzyme family protein [Myxococcota bacterium]